MSESGWERTRRHLGEARDALLMQTNIGVTCGKCGSEDVYFDPCPECDYAQTFTCFGCGVMDRLLGTHDPECSKR